ncbi:protein regulator of cytokinesis 1-like isoform X2 [Mercenaria mercenaria]|uniref:protein regulator of cytokinesis 1-like isoform X2 n=1 Tax=Mercenaria mercenaria TaxID=6596 RepID=UPI00234E58E7|nr:protein regulator of cytokinesis 1-like isoform X2 [Mercenaria mercenaria]
MESSKQLLMSLEKAMDRLNKIWDRIGIGRAAKEERSSTVLRHLQGLLDDMVEEEETLEKQIEQRVEDLTVELKQLIQDLNLQEFKKTPGLAVLQVEKELRTKVETLRKEKKERMKILAKLKQEDQLLCDAMCMTPYYIPSGTTPSGEQLEQLKQHVEKLAVEKTQRYETFIKQKKEITDLMLQMDRSPESGFEKEVVNEEEASFTLSKDNMHALDALVAELLSSKTKLEMTVAKLWDKLHTLWERLEVAKHEQELFEDGKEGIKPAVIEALNSEIQRCEAQKLAHIQKFIDGMRQELELWWNKCYFSAKQRSEFKFFTETNYTEELLELHEKEVMRLKEHYETHKQILELVGKREILFNKMIEFEKRANDPNRFFSDRGGKLLLEEKERKALMKQLPKVEQAVKDDILLWEKEHGRSFLVNGMSFIRYIEKTWTDYEEAKVREKEERQKARTKLMNEEMIFGSKPSTPVKRRFQTTNTPTKTPKYRKIDSTCSSGSSTVHVNIRINDSKTPASSTSRMQHTTVYHSPYRKAPVSAVPQASKVMSASSKTAPGSRNRRRSNRLARKVLAEKKEGTNETVFSHTTVSSNTNTGFGGNISLASTGSYHDFASTLSVNHHSTQLFSPSPKPKGLHSL